MQENKKYSGYLSCRICETKDILQWLTKRIDRRKHGPIRLIHLPTAVLEEEKEYTEKFLLQLQSLYQIEIDKESEV